MGRAIKMAAMAKSFCNFSQKVSKLQRCVDFVSKNAKLNYVSITTLMGSDVLFHERSKLSSQSALMCVDLPQKSLRHLSHEGVKTWPSGGRGIATVVPTNSCWKCGKMLNGGKELFFCECGVIQPPSREGNYFEIMDVDTDFEVDTKKLHNKYRHLQSFLHPDKFSQKSDREKDYSAEQSAMVNKAFNTLQKPLTRGLYMLDLYGFSIEEGDIQMDSEFLMDMMEINEAVEDAGSSEKLKTIARANAIIMSGIYQQLARAFKAKEFQNAKMLLAKAKYYSSVEEKIKEKQSIFLTQGR